MMTNKERYNTEINTNKYYHISIHEFLVEVEAENMMQNLLESLAEKDDYLTAVDFSIPLIMVKYFRKLGW